MTSHGLKTALRSVIGQKLSTSPRFWRTFAGRALILMYHRVLPKRDAPFVQDGMYVTPATFECHLHWLTQHFHLLSLRSLIEMWNEDEWDDRMCYCAITFDDGWIDNYRYAYPLLSAYGAPATIFLPTSLIGTREWLWPDRLGYLLNAAASQGERVADSDSAIERAKRLPATERAALIDGLAQRLAVRLPDERCFLDWDEVREMASCGIEFASHTSSHALLPALDAESLRRELRQPLDTLACELNTFAPLLAYPNGDHSDTVVDAARAAGYAAAVTTQPGLESRAGGNRLRLKRVGAHEDVAHTISLFAFHIGQQLAADRWSS